MAGQPSRAVHSVAVVVVNWNGADFLRNCLDSIFSQTITPQQIVVVDNASQDSSVQVIKSFEGIDLVRLEENTGFARGNNIALSHIHPDIQWVALLNSDAVADPCWLERLIEASNLHPEHSFFGSTLFRNTSVKTFDGDGDCYHMSGYAFRSKHLDAYLADHTSVDYSDTFSVCAAAAMYRLDAVRHIGGFDERFFCYFEDTDLCFRLRLLGHKGLQVHRSTAIHIGSASTGGARSDFAVYYGHRNCVWCFVKNMPLLLFILALPVHIIFNLLAIAYFVSKRQGAVILKAKIDAFLGLSSVIEQRKHIQNARVVSSYAVYKMMYKITFAFFSKIMRRYLS
jgi:GT2 family glycosyltransferase